MLQIFRHLPLLSTLTFHTTLTTNMAAPLRSIGRFFCRTYIAHQSLREAWV